ncbi:DUF2975 domain-containing protein [Lachnospiraceae bacterium ZAX-1]
MKDRLTIITKWILEFMFWTGIVVTITVPISFYYYGAYSRHFRENYLALCLLFMLSGILAILIIGELRKVFRTVIADDCFIRANVKSLDRMGTYSFLISFITVFRLFLYLTPAVLIIVLVFLIAGLFSKVLARVFDRAVTFKLENDLTI